MPTKASSARAPRFRTRLLLILLIFALTPAVLLTLAWSGTVSTAAPWISGVAGWRRVTSTGQAAIDVARSRQLTAAEKRVIDAHEQELGASLEQSSRFRYLADRASRVVGALSILAFLVIAFIAWRVAGHLSRQLSRPVDEIIGWTELISRGRPLPAESPGRGAPEFETLRRRMRKMAGEIAAGRKQAVEAERLHALRESSRQFAHELKNPLTPIRFAVDRIAGGAPPDLAESVEVLRVETRRLERMARSFADFGRLPAGPAAEIDIGELVRYAASSTVPSHIRLELELPQNLPLLRGHHDALVAALSNVLINAVEACGNGGEIHVGATRVPIGAEGEESVRISVADSGCGVPPEKLGSIWDPYITNKPGGTGLGLAIARQTILAHGGEVTATSEVRRGTEIVFVLPLRGIKQESDGPEPTG